MNTQPDITFEAVPVSCAGEAIKHAYADPRLDTAIHHGGKHYAVARATAERLERCGVGFAYLHDHRTPDGTWQIFTVPVHDD